MCWISEYIGYLIINTCLRPVSFIWLSDAMNFAYQKMSDYLHIHSSVWCGFDCYGTLLRAVVNQLWNWQQLKSLSQSMVEASWHWYWLFHDWFTPQCPLLFSIFPCHIFSYEWFSVLMVLLLCSLSLLCSLVS